MIERFDRAFVWFNRWLLIAILAAMSVIVFANVALRYLTSESIVWSEEVARFLMIWLTFLGCGLALRYGGHLAVDNLQDAVSPRIARALRILIVLCVLGFALLLVSLGIGYMQRTWLQTTPVTNVPVGLIYGAVPIGFAFLIVHLALVARRFVAERRYDRSPDEFEGGAGGSL